MRRLWIIGAIAVFLVIYLTVGVPWLSNLVENSGVLIAFPVFIAFYCVFAYFIGGIVGQGPRALALFVFAYLLGDIWAPPILVSSAGVIPALPSQQLASDVFFFKLFTSQGIGVTVAWWLTYLGVPLLCAIILVYELKTKIISRHIPRLMV